MSDLPAIHQALLAALDELEALTARPSFDPTELSGTRYRLSRLSSERRREVEALCDRLLPHVTPEHAAQIKALRSAMIDARIASTGHISTWTLREIEADWPGYCRASNAMRAQMRAQIEREKALLYPTA